MRPHHGAMTLPCRHLFYLMPATLFTTLCRYPQALPCHKEKRTTDRRVSVQGLHAINGSGGGERKTWITRRCRPQARTRLLCAPEKNKLPGEAVPEPGARWDGCAIVLPRKEPDSACIQRGDKHHFRGVRFDLPCIPLGGRSPSVCSGICRTGGERRSTGQ